VAVSVRAGAEGVKIRNGSVEDCSDRVAGAEEDCHGLPDSPADAEEHRGEKSALRRGEEHFVDELPSRRSEGFGGFSEAIRHGFQRVFPDRNDDGNAH
jgi:hypothetical protein